jgi:hypothetical protein
VDKGRGREFTGGPAVVVRQLSNGKDIDKGCGEKKSEIVTYLSIRI